MSYLNDTGPISFNDILTAASVTGFPDTVVGAGANTSSPLSINDANYNVSSPDNAWVFGKAGKMAPGFTVGGSAIAAPTAYAQDATGTVYNVTNEKTPTDPTAEVNLNDFRGQGVYASYRTLEYLTSAAGTTIYAPGASTVIQGDLKNMTRNMPSNAGVSLVAVSFISSAGYPQIQFEFGIWDTTNPTALPASSVYSNFTLANIRIPGLLLEYLDTAASPNYVYVAGWGLANKDSRMNQPGSSLSTNYYWTGYSKWYSDVSVAGSYFSTTGLMSMPVAAFFNPIFETDVNGYITGTVNAEYRKFFLRFGDAINSFIGDYPKVGAGNKMRLTFFRKF